MVDIPSHNEVSDTGHPEALYVQYGCGLSAPPGWLNFDASPRLKLEQMPIIRHALKRTFGTIFPENVLSGDIVAGLPVPDGASAGVYCSHVLEHLPREDVPVALHNTAKMLRPDGIFRLIVPDLRWRAEQYLQSATRAESGAADQFMDGCLLGKRAKLRGPPAILREYFGNSAHLWMYDFACIKQLLLAAGFSTIRRCEFGDAKDAMFSYVENRDRYIENDEFELAIEAARS